MTTTQNSETKRHRGKNFSALDDLNICIGWLAISNDPLKGRDQQGDTFWKDVQDHANLKNRNWDAIRQRWGQISRGVIKFVKCYDLVVQNQTGGGGTQNEIYDEAVRLYLTKTNTKAWKFSVCWEMLRNSPKFIHIYETKTALLDVGPSTFQSGTSSLNDIDTYDTESNAGGTFFGDLHSTSEISNACDAENVFQHPDDWQESKYVPQNDLERRRVEALELLAKAADRKNELIAEHTRALQAATDAKIITTSVNNLDSLSLQILELKKMKILIELQNADNKIQ